MKISACFVSDQKPILARFLARSRRGFYYGLGIMASLFALVAQAQTPMPVTPLTLADAIDLALGQHPTLQVYAARQQAQLGRIHQAEVGTRPEIGFLVEDALGTGEHESFRNAQSTLSITWVLERELIDSRIRSAQAAATAVEFERDSQVLDLAAQTARLFIDVLIQAQRLQLAQLARQQAEEVLDAISRRVAAGKGSSVEKLQARAELARRELELEDLQHKQQASQYQLVAQWGGEAHAYQVTGDLLSIPAVDDFQQQLQRLKQNPAVQALANQQRILESEMELARIEAKPRWQLSAGIRRYETSDDYGLLAGVSIPWGKDKRSIGKLQSLQAQQLEYQSEAEALTRRLDAQLYVLLQEVAHSQHVIEALTGDIIPLLKDALREAKHAYSIGMRSYLEWSAVRQELLSAQAQLLDAYQDIHLQHIELQRLTGASLSQ